MVKSLRDVSITPALYKLNQNVWLRHIYQYKDIDDSIRMEFRQGRIIQVGVSAYDMAYDWYVIELDDTKQIIESWWMTGWTILY